MARPAADIHYGPEVEVETAMLTEGDGDPIGTPEDDLGYGEDIEEDIAFEVVDDDEDREKFNEAGAMLESMDVPFGSNLIKYIDDDELNILSGELVVAYEIDLRSRSEWEETYREGIEILGLKVEQRTCPWEGAFGAHHPLLAEAVVKFQSETIVETFPAQGPVKTKIIGDSTKEREASAVRVREDMNHLLTDEMVEYRAEHEKMLWSLPIAGSAFKKIWFDSIKNRPCTQFVPAEDLIVSYGASDLASAGRYTHRMKKSANEFLKLQLAGFYDPEVSLLDPVPDSEETDDTKDEFTGLDSSEDDRYTFLEMHVNIDLAGFEDIGEDDTPTGLELPYVVTIEKQSQTIVSIYRNWEEGDVSREKRIHFSHYTYIYGFGFYGLGLVNLIGGFAKGATAIMRQLVDAGTLSNLPGGYKTRGFRIVGGEHPIAPGEFRDTDVATGTLKENIMPLPFKEPSIVLFELLKAIVEEGRRFAAVSDVNIADMQPNSPVGSTLAILERTLKTMTAVQARIHAAMKIEFKLIKDIVATLAPEEYNYDAFGDAGQRARQADYNVVEIIPVSDPNASTMSQRIVMYQAALQLMQMKPDIYDQPYLHRSMLNVLGMKDAEKIVPEIGEIPATDPVTENMNILKGAPVRAEQHQNHEAHITVLMSFIQDPQIQSVIQQEGPGGAAKIASAMAHLNEHMAFAYRQKMEKELGQQLPPPDQPLPPEQENQMAAVLAQAAQGLLQNSQQEQAMAQQKQEEADPLNIIQREELNIKAADQALKERKQADDFKIDKAELLAKAASAEFQDQKDQRDLEIKMMKIIGDDKLARDFKAQDDKLSRDSKSADVDIAEYQGKLQDKASRRQAQSASRAMAGKKKSERAKEGRE